MSLTSTKTGTTMSHKDNTAIAFMIREQQRNRELEVLVHDLFKQLHKVELRLRIAVSVAVGATAGLVTLLLF